MMRARRYSPEMEILCQRTLPTTIITGALIGAISDSMQPASLVIPPPSQEPDPGELPTFYPAIVYPPLPPSGPVGPG